MDQQRRVNTLEILFTLEEEKHTLMFQVIHIGTKVDKLIFTQAYLLKASLEELQEVYPC